MLLLLNVCTELYLADLLQRSRPLVFSMSDRQTEVIGGRLYKGLEKRNTEKQLFAPAALRGAEGLSQKLGICTTVLIFRTITSLMPAEGENV